MTSRSARATRRAALVFSGGLATLLAHGAAVGHETVTAGSILMLSTLSLLAAMSVAFRPRRTFRDRGLAALVLAQLCLQGVFHLAMGWAPWAFGLPPHPGDAVLEEAALAPHLIAALVLALVCLGVDRFLGTALEAIALLRQLLQSSEPGARSVHGHSAIAVAIATSQSRRSTPAAPRAPPS